MSSKVSKDGPVSRIAKALADAERDRLRRDLGCPRREKAIGAERLPACKGYINRNSVSIKIKRATNATRSTVELCR